MATPYFVADSASVTIMRSLASSSYGSYSLNLPDGIELEDVHDFDAPDNTLGYVAHVGHGRRVGGLARRFVRADVNVSAADPSDPDRFPDSDVDRVLRDVAERVSGDFFLESDVSKAGLGPWVPHVDFKVGDLARVEIWGQVVVLPVTRIEEVVSDHDIVDWRVHVGGQLVSDEEARKAENLALHRAFLQDRRELAGVEGIASQAARTAGEAQQVSSTLDDDLDRSVEVVAGELGLPVPEKEHRLEVSLGEVLAQAIEANTAAIGLAFPQESIIPTGLTGLPYWAVGAQSSSDRPEIFEPPTDFSEYSFRPSGGSSDSDRAFFKLSSSVDYKISVWVRGDVGQRAVVSLLDEDGEQVIQQWQPWYPTPGPWAEGQRVEIMVPDPDEDEDEEPEEWTRHEWVVRLTPGTRRARLVVDGGGSAGTPWLNRLSVSVLNRPQEEVDKAQSEQIAESRRITDELRVITESLGQIQNLLAESLYAYLSYTVTPREAGQSWTELWSTTVAVPVTYTVYMRIGWQDATMIDSYGVSFYVNGVRRGVWEERGLGPLFGGDYRVQSRRWTGVRVEAGDTISFRVRSNATFGFSRRIEDGMITLTQET